ncbi:hypothetical protein BH11MYX2_BH11MYX2_11380 [soil metagenome]
MRARLTRVPSIEPDESAETRQLIEDEIAWLASDEASALIARDAYWPKWDSPWWSMVLLWELGEATRIPQRAADAMVAKLGALRLKIFPIHPGELPEGASHQRDVQCHCALGSMDQVLTAAGVDVDRALPWVAPWYPRYQMADGGLNCDEEAYLVTDEVASSMVGTVAPMEAMLRREPTVFAERASGFLIARALRLGSPTSKNAEERTSAETWGALTFPRFYFYDTLRGLALITRFAIEHDRVIPIAAIENVVTDLCTRFADGNVTIGRRGFAIHRTIAPDPDNSAGPWKRREPNVRPLLDAVSQIGAVSPTLTRQWSRVRARLGHLLDRGRIQT